MELFDTHCHLAMKDFGKDLEAVVSRAREAGVSGMVTVGTSPEDWAETERVAARSGILSAYALSPHDAKLWNAENSKLLRGHLASPQARAVGETGLDYHYNLSSKEQQQASFADHIAIAGEAGMPLIIHSRDSFEDTVRMLAGVKVPVVIHCFTYGMKEAEAFLAMGFFISFSGIATFPKALEIQEAARIIPRSRMLVETDAPYLAPVPFRGKRCEPAFVAATAAYLAGLRGEDPEEFASKTSANAKTLFGTKK